ncbi:MAG: hypothetical protein ACP5XB_26765 [Isosphaeraceae bacterium]
MNRAALLVCFAVGQLSIDPAWCAGAPLREEFLREYPAAAERLAGRLKKDGRGRVVVEDSGQGSNGAYNHVKTYSYYISGDDLRLDISGDEPGRDGDTEREGRGAQGSAAALRGTVARVLSGGRHFLALQRDPGGPFMLGRMEEGRGLLLDYWIKEFTEAPLRLLSLRIADELVDGGALVVGDVSEPPPPDEALVRVAFRGNRLDRRGKKIASGWLELDSRRGWALRGYHIELTSGQTYDCRLTYDVNLAGEPSPCLLEREFVNPGRSRSKLTYRFKPFEPGPVDRSEFTLAAFGLPEVGTRRAATPASLWLFALAGAALAVGLALKRYARMPEKAGAS